MKHLKKSASFPARAFFFLSLCFLSGCADVPVPSWLTGEPDADVLTSPRVVSVPAKTTDRVWPNLADVPDTKPVFTTDAVRTGRAEDMNSDRLKAQVQMERLRNIQLQGVENSGEAAAPVPFSFSALRPSEPK